MSKGLEIIKENLDKISSAELKICFMVLVDPVGTDSHIFGSMSPEAQNVLVGIVLHKITNMSKKEEK